jgi:hypothetical protein
MMRTIYEQRPSGLIAPAEPPKPPPEHPVREIIRECLADLSKRLEGFEHTTHGGLGPFTIEAAADALVECYNRPKAYTISDLAQHIDGLVEGRE